MQIALKHGLKLTLANFLGFLMNFALSFLLNLIFTVLILLLSIVAAGGVGFFTGFSFTEEAYELIVGSMTIVPVIIVFVLYILLSVLINSMLIGGLYGSTIEAVYENRSSIQTYFRDAFRHMVRLTGWQLVVFLLAIPIIILFIVGMLLFKELFGEVLVVIPILFAIVTGMLFLVLFIHSPIFIVKHRSKAWRSIALSFRLLRRRPLRVLLSGILSLGWALLINGIYILIFGSILFVIYLLLSVYLSEEIVQALLGFATLILLLIEGLVVIPFSGVMSLSVLINHYKNHFDHLIEGGENEEWIYRAQQPIFEFKDHE